MSCYISTVVELNLPSISTEDMTEKRKKRNKREDCPKGGSERRGHRGTKTQMESVRSQSNLRKRKVVKNKKLPENSDQMSQCIFDDIIQISGDSFSSLNNRYSETPRKHRE